MMGVRRALPGDEGALGRLHIETWQIAYADIFDEEFLSGLDNERRSVWFKTAIAEERELWVAPEVGALRGFSFFGESRKSDWAELYAIYVHPDFWGEGVGYGLLSQAETRLAELGFDRVLLWVIERNDRARRFYERQGWTLGRPVKLEEIGGTQVTELRYEKELRERP